ncbi:MOB kinase activator-like 1-like protein B [Diplonema papillatum]|nr:MOB kinase activator-like 1-like protein B [Diplonema papillatum]
MEKNGEENGAESKSQRHTLAKTFLTTEELEKLVALPEGVDVNDWLATHTYDFYKVVNVLFGSITQFCTAETCEVMSCGRYEYCWKDKAEYRKATKVSAPLYVDLLMRWIEDLLNDENTFPTSDSKAYPADFLQVTVKVCKRLFRVYAHIYHDHFLAMRRLEQEAHLNTAFKHFTLFCFQFRLLDATELSPLRGLIVNLLGKRFDNYFDAGKSARLPSDEG